MFFVISVTFVVTLYIYLHVSGLYGSLSASTGLYPTLDLWNVNKFHYIT
jgi:hypothetical protein